MSNRVVLVLGAGLFQRGLVEALVSEGFDPQSASSNSQTFTDRVHHLIDAGNPQAVYELIIETNAIAVLSAASDYVLPAWQQATTARWGRWPLCDAGLFTNKMAYKKRLCSAEVPVPEAFFAHADFLRHQRLDSTYLVKPLIGSGSRGISRFEAGQAVDWDQFFVEEYLSGDEFGGDVLFSQGAVYWCLPTLKTVNTRWVPISHRAVHDSTIRSELTSYFTQIAKALQIESGIFNFDVIRSANGWRLIDFSPRIGGNAIPELNHLAHGVSEYKDLMVLNELIQKPFSLPSVSKPAAVYIIHAEVEGILVSLNAPPPAVDTQQVRWSVAAGQRVVPFSEGRYHIGYVLFSAATEQELDTAIQLVKNHRWFTLAE